jgi:SAM-dependent methyltransferase
VRLRELLVGVEGLALLRHLYDGSDEEADRRLAEVRRLLHDDAFAIGEPTSEAEPRDGYRSWSESYDEPGNPIVAIEQPVVWSLVEALPAGRALDAACGTGRHTRRLVDLGHDVTGVDITPEMLERAAASVPEARFLRADLRRLPFDDGSFDLVVCGLALSHLPELEPAVRELARVLRPDGHMVVSVLHPFQAHLGWHAPFADESGARGFVREYPHTHAAFLGAFRAAGLELSDCAEPRLELEHVRTKRRAFEHVPEAAAAAYAGLPGVLVWDVTRAASS